MADLKTTYNDDVLDTSVNTKRKFNMITNEDGTVSFEDVTEYSQVGDSFGGADINATNRAINALNNALSNYTTTLWYTLDGWAGIDAKSSKTVEREISIPNSMTIDFVEYNSANGIFMHFWKLVGTNLYVGLFNTTDNNYTLNDTDGIIVHYKLSR